VCAGDLVVQGEGKRMHLGDFLVAGEFGLLVGRGSVVGVDANRGDFLIREV